MPEWSYANCVVIIFLIITTCLNLMSPLLLFSGMTPVAKQWWGISGMQEIYQHIRICLKLLPSNQLNVVVQLHLRALYTYTCARCNSRHTPTATSLVTAAPRLTTGERPDCTVQQDWHRSERFGTDFDKWASGARTYTNVLLFLTLPVTVVTAKVS